jgi:hypothetical protein
MRLERSAIALSLALLFIVPFVHGPVFAQETLKDKLTRQYKEEKDICPVVKKNIREGLSPKEITKSCIQLGHDACLVVRCGVEANGNLEQIITGAIEAGTTSDVCSRCAMNAGADPKAIAAILETGLGYSPVSEGGLTPIETSLPGGNKPGGVMSSSSFK